MAPGLSRSLGGEVQLGRCKRDIEVNRKKCAPHTPPVDYTCKNHLLRVVSDVGPKEVYCPSVVTIGTHHDVHLRHVRAEWVQDSR